MESTQLISIDVVRSVRDQSDGWEESWWKLHLFLEEKILQKIQRDGRLTSTADIEEFVAEYFDYQYRGAVRGVLLINWEEDVPVDLFLTKQVKNRINSYLEKRQKAAIVSLTGRHEDGGDIDIAADDTPPLQLDSRVQKIVRRFTSDVVSCQKFERRHHFGGIQFHPKLDWDHEGLTGLRADMEIAIKMDDSGWEPREVLLNAEHRQADERFRCEIEKNSEEIEKLRGGTSIVKIGRLEGRIFKTMIEQQFYPLDKSAVMRVLSVTANNAYKLRERHMKKVCLDLEEMGCGQHGFLSDMSDEAEDS